MVKKYNSSLNDHKASIKADVIILGCSLPGIVTAHKLKKRFGNTMDIVVLELTGQPANVRKCNVTFQDTDESNLEDNSVSCEESAQKIIDNLARFYLTMYAKEFKIHLPDIIVAPEIFKSNLNKLFQHENGDTVESLKGFHDFDYLNLMEKFEINQYQNLLDQNMRNLFKKTREDSTADRKRLLYFDQTTMEQHINNALLFQTSRDIMRTTVRLVCGAPANTVSVLFYLHRCYRTNSSRNHLDGNNTRLREKLLGYCRHYLSSKLQQSVADITLQAKTITEIRTYSDEQVVLETMKGEANYVCSLLAMALNPDQLSNIQVEDSLLAKNVAKIIKSMTPGRTKKFLIQYKECFWRKLGYCGDILSLKGPIIWAMEKPAMSATGSSEKYPALVGYLVVKDGIDSKELVVEQLMTLFGVQAASVVSYSETDIGDVFVPRCGDFIALKEFTGEANPKYLEWGTLDMFAEGDVAASLEAGHTAYLNLLSCLRPQAQLYEDLSVAEGPRFVGEGPMQKWLVYVNITSGIRLVVYTSIAYVGFRLFRNFIRKYS